MNIFYVDACAVKAAQALCNKHIVKMPLESAQMLCTCVHQLAGVETPYKPTHANHGCNLWARSSAANFEWLLNHAWALCHEYTFRYDKIHKAQSTVEWCSTVSLQFDAYEMTPVYQAMPDVYKSEDAVTAYRDYYTMEKFLKIDCRWTRRRMPTWL